MVDHQSPPSRPANLLPTVILVEPQLGENIGMVARAMANFGLEELRLVNPRDGWPSETARAAASRADHVIDGVRLYQTVPEAVADLSYVLATTARPRDSTKIVIGPDEASAGIHAREAQGQRTGILFGKERFGLSNEEISYADAIVTFPVNPAFASLNIAQAVLLMSYEWRRASGVGGGRPGFEQRIELELARKDDLHRLFEHFEGALDRAGYFFPVEKKEVMIMNMREMLTRASFTEAEVRALRGMIRSLERGRGPSDA